MASIIITEKQMELIVKQTEFQENLRLAEENWAKLSNQQKQYVLEICKVFYPQNKKLIKEQKDGPKTLEELARSQMNLTQLMEADVSAIRNKIVGGVSTAAPVLNNLEGFRNITSGGYLFTRF